MPLVCKYRAFLSGFHPEMGGEILHIAAIFLHRLRMIAGGCKVRVPKVPGSDLSLLVPQQQHIVPGLPAL